MCVSVLPVARSFKYNGNEREAVLSESFSNYALYTAKYVNIVINQIRFCLTRETEAAGWIMQYKLKLVEWQYSPWAN